MPGKKDNDAVASFFGDDEDLDWIDEEESGVFERPRAVSETLTPVLDEDAVATAARLTAIPDFGTDEVPYRSVSDDSAPEAAADAARMTAIPDLDEDPESPPSDRDEGPTGPDPAADIDTVSDAFDDPSEEEPVPVIQAVRRAGVALDVANTLDPDASSSATAGAPGEAPEPQPDRSDRPHRSGRSRTPTDPPQISKSPSPPPAFAPPRFDGRNTFVPREATSDAHAPRAEGQSKASLPTPPELWREAAAGLQEGEASDRVDEARIRVIRLGDDAGARRALDAAGDAPGTAWLRAQMAPREPEVLEAWAAESTGPAAADLWRARASLEDADGVRFLDRAIEADPDDVESHLLRLSRVDAGGRTPVLASLADTVGGPARVVHDLERARLAWSQGDRALARTLVDHAAEAAPGHLGVWALQEALGIEGAWPAEPPLEGWTCWLRARHLDGQGETGAADAAWRTAVSRGGLDPLAAWWCARRGDPQALADACHAAVDALEDRVTPMARFAAALAVARAGRADEASAMLAHDVASFGPAEVLAGSLRAVRDASDLSDATLEKGAAEGDVEAAWLLARRHDKAGAAASVRCAAWSAVPASDPFRTVWWIDAARAAGDDAALAEALSQRWEEVEDGPGRAALAVALAALGQAVDDDVARLTETSQGLGQAAPELIAWTLRGAGRPVDAADALLEAAGQTADEVSIRRRLEAVILLVGTGAASDATRAESVLDSVLDDVANEPRARRMLLAMRGPDRPDLLFHAMRDLDTRDAAGAAWLLAWVDGADMPVPEDVGGRALLTALHSATKDAASERVRRWEAAGGGGVVRLAARAEALLEQSPGVAAIVLDGSHEDASPALARLAWRAGRPDLAARLVEGFDGLPEDTRTWLAVESATEASELHAGLAAIDALDDDALRYGALWATAMHASADEEVTRAVWPRLAACEAAPGAVRAAASARCALTAEGPEVLECWRAVLRHRPGAGDAFHAVRRACQVTRDEAGMVALFEAQRPDDRRGLAEALDLAGSPDPSRWAALVGSDEARTYDRIALEVALLRCEDWEGLVAAWTARIEALGEADDGVRARLEARRRWLLVNRLAESDTAWSIYSSLHEANPDDREVRVNLGRIAAARGETALALEHLGALRDSATGPADRAQALRWIAEVHEGAGQDEDAHQAWLAALDASPDDLDALEGLRRFVERQEAWDDLHVVLKRLTSLLKGEARVEPMRALARLLQGPLDDPARARETWEEIGADHPDDPEALEALLALALAADDDDAIVRVGRRLIALTEGDARRAHRAEVGARCEAAGRRDTALELYEEGLADTPPDAGAAASLERIARTMGDAERIIRARIAQAEAASTNEEAAEHLAEAARVQLLQRYDRDAAHELWSQVLDRVADHQEALQFEAVWLYDAARYGEALEVHERLARFLEEEDLDDPDTRVEVTTFYFRFGRMLALRGDHEGAMGRWVRALELNPSHLPTLEALGPEAAKMDDWVRVRDVYTRLLQLTGGQGEPEDVARTYAMLGHADLRDGTLAKARRRLQRALEIRPGFVPALRGMAEVHERDGAHQKALLVYNEVIASASPDDEEDAIVEAYLTKGRLLDDHMERADKAREHYAGCLSYKPGEPRALTRMMELALRQSQWEDATRHGQEALAADVEASVRATIWLGLAIARRGLEDDDGSRDAMAKAIKADPALDALDAGDSAALAKALRERLPR